MRRIVLDDPFCGINTDDVRRREYCPVVEIDSVMFDGARSRNLVIENIHLPYQDPTLASYLWHIECRGGRISRVMLATEPLQPTSFSWTRIDGKGGLLIPSLCHSHIHLDKCFILDKCDNVVDGTFEEAVRVTRKVKARFKTEDTDLRNRAQRLIRESLESGVTAMRTHVDVDTTVGLSCLRMACALKREWEKTCDIQVAAFSQDPLFSDPRSESPNTNFELLAASTDFEEVSVIGSAPYVEPTLAQAKQNIDCIVELAIKSQLHVDFHLDYNIDGTSEPLIYHVIEKLRQTNWNSVNKDRNERPRRVTIGHATRLQLFTPAQWRNLKEITEDLPIMIVSLPQSDLYMMGRDYKNSSFGAPRGTLRIPQLLRDYQIDIAMGINNVENAFTPQGSLDPLSLCSLGVGIFQAATPQDIRALLRSVSVTSKQAIGVEEIHKSLIPTKGDPADFLLLYNCTSIRSALLNPPLDRTTIRAGKVVARRLVRRWNRLGMATDDAQMPKRFDPWYKKIYRKYLVFPPYLLYKRSRSILYGTKVDNVTHNPNVDGAMTKELYGAQGGSEESIHHRTKGIFGFGSMVDSGW